MTKNEILEYFKDINHAYNDCTRYDTLKRMLDELQEPCADAISRQAVEDAIYDYSRSCDVNYAQIMEYIEKIPSVKPQYTDAEIQKMQDLEFAEIQKAYEIGKAENIDVLDKIRAEIEKRKFNSGGEPNRELAFNVCLQIIDKYKASPTGAERSTE